MAEAKLRADMLGWDCADLARDSMLARYAASDMARMTSRSARLRAFRRQVTRDIVLFQDELSPGTIEWRVDFAPGARTSATDDAKAVGLDVWSDLSSEARVFADLDDLAWGAYLGGRAPNPAERRSLTRTSVTEYEQAVELRCAYNLWLGVTRGRAKDVFAPFGKSSV